MDRLKTPAEKAAEMMIFRGQQALQKEQQRIREEQKRLQEEEQQLLEIEKYKSRIVRIINDSVDFPILLPDDDDLSDLREYLVHNTTRAINIWLAKDGYEMKPSNGYVNNYHIVPEDYDYKH